MTYCNFNVNIDNELLYIEVHTLFLPYISFVNNSRRSYFAVWVLTHHRLDHSRHGFSHVTRDNVNILQYKYPSFEQSHYSSFPFTFSQCFLSVISMKSTKKFTQIQPGLYNNRQNRHLNGFTHIRSHNLGFPSHLSDHARTVPVCIQAYVCIPATNL